MGLVLSAVYATGAFTSLTAQRDANIQVAGDASSYLTLQPAPGPNGEYATQRNGKLHVSLTGAIDGAGKGVNRNALTVVRNIFTITNKGSQPVGVWLTDKSKAVTFKGGKKWQTLEGREQAITLRPGQTLSVGLTVDTREQTSGDLINAMTIHAKSDISGTSVENGSASSKTRSEPVVTPPIMGGDTTPNHNRTQTKSETETDSDGDLLSDHAETVWGTDPGSADTDGDGIPDLRDPNPTRDNTPPIIEAQSRQWGDYFVLDVSGNGKIKNIDVKAHFQPDAPWDDAQWVSNAENVEKLGNGKYRVNIKDWGWLSENPNKYQITITDEKDHTIRYRVDLTGNGAQLQKVAASGLVITASSPIPGDAVIFGGLVVAAIGVDIAYDYAVNSPEPVTKKQLSTEIQISDTAATYKPGETDPRIEMPVRLPSGRTYEAPKGNKRRFGKEQIVQLPGITSGNAEETVGGILKAPSAIRHEGKYTIVIGDNPRGPGKLKLWLHNGVAVKGVIQAANPVGPTGEEVDIDEDHAIREDGNHPSYEKARKTVEDPDEIWEKGPHRTYVKKIDGEWVTVRAYDLGDKYNGGTAVIYETYSELKKFLKKKGYDPSDQIYP
jgi:hypothetical protein